MSNNYDKRMVDTYTILRSKADKTRTMDVVDGKSEPPVEYSTSKQAQEVFDSLKDKYVMGYATMYDIRSLSKYGEGDVTYGEVSKLLKKIFPENTKMSLEKYAQLLGIEETDELDQIKVLYDILKETAKRYEIEDTLFGKGKQPIDITVEQMKLIYEDMKKEESFNIFDEMEKDEDLLAKWDDEGMDQSETLDGEDEVEPFEAFDDDEPLETFEEEEEDSFDTFEEDGEVVPLEPEDEPIETFEDEEEDSFDTFEASEDEEEGETLESFEEDEPIETFEDEDDIPVDLLEEKEFEVHLDEPNTENMDEITIHITESEPEEETPNEEVLTKTEVMQTLEGIYRTYREKGHFLWTKWLALQISRVEDDDADVTDAVHEASAELGDNFLKEFYFHLRDDLKAEMAPEMTEYSARTQIMGMCLYAFAKRDVHRIYSEIAEGIYSYYVLSYPETLQTKEVKDLRECDLTDEWKEIYAPLLGNSAFPLEKEYYEPEVDVRGYEVKEDVDSMEFKELDILPQPVEELDYEEPLREEIEADPLYSVCEEPDSSLLRPEEEEVDMQPKKKKKKAGIFRKIVRTILWLVVVACIVVLGYASYSFYQQTEQLKVENIQLNHKLDDAQNEMQGMKELEVYKEREEDFETYLIKNFNNKRYGYVKDLIDNYYGKDTNKLPKTLKPIYNRLVKLVK